MRDLVAHRDGFVVRGDGEIAIIDLYLVSPVWFAIDHGLFPGTPPALVGIDMVECRVDRGGIAYGIEDEKFRLAADIAGISDTSFFQIFLSMPCNTARVSGVCCTIGIRFVHEKLHIDGLACPERIDISGRNIRVQHHVGFIDCCEAVDRRPVKGKSFIRRLFGKCASGNGQCVFYASQVSKAHVQKFDGMGFKIVQ